jgi:hypothetical protein
VHAFTTPFHFLIKKNQSIMKKLFFFAALLLAFTFVACNKDEDATINDDNVITTEDLLATEDIISDAEDEVDEIIENQLNEVEIRDECPTKTITPTGNNFPKTITLDYGDGCTSLRGKVKKGKIIIEMTAPMSQSGAMRTLTFVNYYVDSAKVEGSSKLINIRTDNSSNPSFTRTTDVKIIFPDGDQASWQGTHTHAIVAGGNTPRRFDDVIEITGNSTITNRDGRTFSSAIIEPLRRAILCPWVSDGIRQVSRNGNTATIDYGFGESCDNKAQVTLPNGETRVIRIEAWWRR